MKKLFSSLFITINSFNEGLFEHYKDALFIFLERFAMEKNKTGNIIVFLKDKNLKTKKIRSDDHFEIIIYKHKKYKIFFYFNVLKAFVKSLHYKIIMVNTSNFYSLLLAIIAKKVFGKKVIHFIHNGNELDDYKHLRPFYFDNIPDIVFVNTNYQIEKLKRQKKVSQPMVKFIRAVDMQIFKPKENKKNIKNGVIKLLYVGVISPVKKIKKIIDFIIEAKCQNKVEFQVVGGVPTQDLVDYKNELIKYALNNGVKISYMDFVDHHKLADIYNSADVFCNLRPDEGFGNVFVEAMACGLPVIGFKGSPGPEELIINEKNGFLIDNAKEFKKIVSDLLKNDKQIKSLSKNSFKFVKKNYSIEHGYKQFKKNLESILED